MFRLLSVGVLFLVALKMGNLALAEYRVIEKRNAPVLVECAVSEVSVGMPRIGARCSR